MRKLLLSIIIYIPLLEEDKMSYLEKEQLVLVLKMVLALQILINYQKPLVLNIFAQKHQEVLTPH